MLTTFVTATFEGTSVLISGRGRTQEEAEGDAQKNVFEYFGHNRARLEWPVEEDKWPF